MKLFYNLILINNKLNDINVYKTFDSRSNLTVRVVRAILFVFQQN